MITWIEEANKHVNEPSAIFEIDLDSGTRKYSIEILRPTNAPPIKANILQLPSIENSIGGILKTLEFSRITIIMDDHDNEFRTIIGPAGEGLKNKAVRIKVPFINLSLATKAKTIFTGRIYDSGQLSGLKFEINCEPNLKNIDEPYPGKTVEKDDYTNAPSDIPGTIILEPYGPITDVGGSNKGAWVPIMVDATVGAEIHLVGRQEYDEKIVNGGFDSDIAGWGTLSTSTLAWVAGGRNGSCLRITGNGAGHPGSDATNFVVIPGHWYYTECYIKAGTEDEYILQIRDKTNTAYIYDTGHQGPIPADWTTKAYIVWQAPAGCILASVFVRSASGGGEAKTIFFDDVMTTEIIEVTRVRFNDVVQVEGAGNDYEILPQIIDEHTHTEIHWLATGPNPTIEDTVTCDIQYGTREPCEMFKHYLETFCEYVDADFDAVSYAAAKAIGEARGYIVKGSFKDEKELVSHRNDLCQEFGVDIWWEPKDGLVHFDYFSPIATPSIHYYDYKDILRGYVPNNDSTAIINYQRYGYGWDYKVKVFRNFDIKQNADSQEKYGETKRGEFKGLYFIRDVEIASDVMSRFILLRKDPIGLDEFPMPIKAFDVSISDMIQITHFEGIGAAGYEGTVFQIRKTIYDLDNFIAKLQCLDYSNFSGAACIMGDAAVLPATWDLTNDAQKKWCYLCSHVTGQFSDGKPGKMMLSQ